MTRMLLAFALFIGPSAAIAAHVSLEIRDTWTNGIVNLSFLVHVADGTKLNLDAPWKLTLEGSNGLFPSSLGVKDFSKELPGFTVTSQKLQAVAQSRLELKYRLVAYSCSTDKTACYRDVLDGVYVPKAP